MSAKEWNPQDCKVKLCSACCKWTSDYSKGNYVKGNYQRKCMRCTEAGAPNATREAVDEAWSFYEPVAEMHNNRKRVPLFMNTLRTIIRECLKLQDGDDIPLAG